MFTKYPSHCFTMKEVSEPVHDLGLPCPIFRISLLDSIASFMVFSNYARTSYATCITEVTSGTEYVSTKPICSLAITHIKVMAAMVTKMTSSIAPVNNTRPSDNDQDTRSIRGMIIVAIPFPAGAHASSAMPSPYPRLSHK